MRGGSSVSGGAEVCVRLVSLVSRQVVPLKRSILARTAISRGLVGKRGLARLRATPSPSEQFCGKAGSSCDFVMSPRSFMKLNGNIGNIYLLLGQTHVTNTLNHFAVFGVQKNAHDVFRCF